MANAMKKARNSQSCSTGLSADGAALQAREDGGVVERAGLVVEIDDAHQHQGRARHGVEEEFDGGINPAFVTPDPDQKVHGNQRDFPEYKEQEEVEGAEYADQSEFQQQQECEELFDVFVDGPPGEQHA